MASTFGKLYDRGLLRGAPKFLRPGVQYEVLMGSVAFGVSNDTSDMDVYGFAIPPQDHLFPHLRGEITDFDEPAPRFAQFQEHHVMDPDALAGKGRSHDFNIYSIVKYFRLCLENNPNMIDSLFVPRRCVLYATPLGDRVRERRKDFLHRGAWHKFKGYAYSQMHKLRGKAPKGKRKALVEEFGFDVKFAYHVVRLLNEVEQILIEQDLDLERSREQLKAIRRGEWSLERLEQYVQDKEADLESAYAASKLPAKPDSERIKALLLECLEQHFGSLEKCVASEDDGLLALREIDAILERVRLRKGW